MPVVGNLIKRHSRLPVLFADTMTRKIIQIIKNQTSGPVAAEWVLYFLSGAVRTMPERGTVMSIIVQEALTESLAQARIKISELSAREYGECLDVINISRPLVHAKLTCVVRKDSRFRERLDGVLGITQDWKGILREAEDIVSRIDKQTPVYREARKARSLWRRLL